MGGAPNSTCTAGVVRMAPPTPNAPDITPDTSPDRMPSRAWISTSWGPVQRLGGPADHLSLAGIRRRGQRLGEREPPDVLHLVVVQGRVSPHGLHQEKGHPLSDPLPAPHEPVGDLTERLDDLSLQPRLFLDLPNGGLDGILAGFHQPFRQTPGQVSLPGSAGGQHDFGALAS